MDFNKVYNKFIELKEQIALKKEIIIKKDLEELSKIDVLIQSICEDISKFNIEQNSNLFSQEEKEKLKNLGQEIKKLQENNEILIKHSLSVINNLLSGIVNIIQPDKCAYNAKGISCSDESLNISSITEEA